MQIQSNAMTMMICWISGASAMTLASWLDATMQSSQYRGSTGACYTEVWEGSFEYRKTMTLILAMTMIARDKYPTESVHEALLGLAEYRNGCSDDMPSI